MSTTMPNVATIQRKWYIIDAADVALGRTATKVATLLRGKHKPCFAPHADCGDFVIVINAEKAILTGNKLQQKFYRHHSGWVGGLKEVKYEHLMEKNPEKAMMLAIKGMIPDNSLGRKSLTRVRIYRGPNHENQAQQPEAWTR